MSAKAVSRLSQSCLPVMFAAAFLWGGDGYASDAGDKAFALRISKGALPAAQRTLRVGKGDTLRLTVTSDTPGELHVHGYRVGARVAAGIPAELRFKAFASGRFPVEWHGAEGTVEKARAHHGPPLAVIEVQPQ